MDKNTNKNKKNNNQRIKKLEYEDKRIKAKETNIKMTYQVIMSKN